MNILIIGNGFDLTHGLPTRYIDFLHFIKYTRGTYSELNIINLMDFDFTNNFLEQQKIDYVKESNFVDEIEVAEELRLLSMSNVWFDYFLHKVDLDDEKTWIDFESEISQVIQSLEYMKNYRLKKLNGNMTRPNHKFEQIEKNIIDIIYKNNPKNTRVNIEKHIESILKDLKLEQEFNQSKYIELKTGIITHITEQIEKEYGYIHMGDKYLESNYLSEIIKILLEDLKKLTRCLEIYLTTCIPKVNIKHMFDDIKTKKIHKVMSFNYTNTFERIYGEKSIICSFVHGNAEMNRDIKSNNMIIGIDEYIKANDGTVSQEYIEFKKYFQRTAREADGQYKKWFKDIRNTYNKSLQEGDSEIVQNDIYIIGHSLDVTDKDILKEIFTLPATNITIYYHKEEIKNELITNIVKAIGIEEFSNRTYVGGCIKLEPQSTMQNLKSPPSTQ